ncbi:MAG: YraN family protein [Rhizobiaceae bacterium]|nr:YraN family protein [Rhizobiaceae bacterium]
MVSKRAKTRAYNKGFWAEFLAAWFLRFKGYRILHMRYKTGSGEIDIIARKRKLIAFVEVKARAHVQSAVDAVSYSSQRRISNAADIWLSRQRDANELSLRFDIIAIAPWKMPVHLKDAF